MSLEQPGVFYFEDLATEDSALLDLFRHGAYPSSVELTPPQLKKLRQLTLISMAEQVKSLSYTEVSQVLELPANTVESFLVDALLEKAVVGKIDARAELLYVTSVATRNANKDRTDGARTMLDGFLARLETLINENMERLKPDEKEKDKKRKRRRDRQVAAQEAVEQPEEADATPSP